MRQIDTSALRPSVPETRPAAEPPADHYALWAVFRAHTVLPRERNHLVIQASAVLSDLPAGVQLRGLYDVSGLRSDADVMLWWHGADATALQQAYNQFRRTRLGGFLAPVWSGMALHRPAEFNRSHVPAFVAGERPREHLSVYPFDRSYEWYLLPEPERARMLAEHGLLARGFADVRANTMPAFSLGDYEWILAFEADDLGRLVDMMRHLRASEARMHVRAETPFYTGRRRTMRELVDGLP
jgi:chlorite dismutase